MNESLLEKILVETIGLSPSEREILASRLRFTEQHGPLDFPVGLIDGSKQPPEPPEALPDAKTLFNSTSKTGE